MYKYATDLKVDLEVLTRDDQIGKIIRILPAWTYVINRYEVEFPDGATERFASCELFEVRCAARESNRNIRCELVAGHTSPHLFDAGDTNQ